MNANGTAIEGVCVTSAANRPGNCPGSKLVWRNICKVGCGWLSDRVTMMKGIRCLYSLSEMSLVMLLKGF